MSARAVAASRSIVRSPEPSSSITQGTAAAGDEKAADLLHVLGIEGVPDAKNCRQFVDDEPILPVERHVWHMAALRHASAVIAGDVRHDGCLFRRQAENRRLGQDVLRMLVMGALAHVHTHVVQQAGDSEQQTLALPEAVLLAQRIEQTGAEVGDVLTVFAIQSISLPQGLGAGQHLLREVLGADPTARLRHIQQHAGPE